MAGAWWSTATGRWTMPIDQKQAGQVQWDAPTQIDPGAVQWDPPAAVRAGRGLMEIPRQVGLAARYGLEGLANMGEIVTEPLRQFVTDPLARAVTGKNVRGQRLGQAATQVADWG